MIDDRQVLLALLKEAEAARDAVAAAAIRLVLHDEAADSREGLDPCVELEHLIEVLDHHAPGWRER